MRVDTIRGELGAAGIDIQKVTVQVVPAFSVFR